MSEVSERVYFDITLMPITNRTKIKIIEAAIQLFSGNGFSGASVRHITKEVGIKESSLYKHFSSKEEILQVIFTNFRIEAEKLLPPLEHLSFIVQYMSLRDFLNKGMENFLNHIEVDFNLKVWRILYLELFRHPLAQEIYELDIIKRTVDSLTTVFVEMIKHGKMAEINARTFAEEYQFSSVSLILEFNLLKSQGKNTKLVEERIKSHVDFFANMGQSKSNGQDE